MKGLSEENEPGVGASGKRSIRSPEQLEEAMKISTPGVWAVVMLSLVALLAFFAWAMWGSIQTKVAASAWIENGSGVMYIPESEMASIDLSKSVEAQGAGYPITSISATPLSADDLQATVDDEILHRLEPAEWTYEVRFDASSLSNGVVPVNVIVEQVKPLSFLIKPQEL